MSMINLIENLQLLLYVITVSISSSCPEPRPMDNSTEDSDTDCVENGGGSDRQLTNSFGQKKTRQYNREPHKKSALMDREKVATRRSWHIKQIMKDKKDLDEVHL